MHIATNTKFRGDILVHSGDFTRFGTEAEFLQFDNWLHAVSRYYLYRIIIPGKNDVIALKSNFGKMTALLPHASHVLCHQEATVLGIRIVFRIILLEHLYFVRIICFIYWSLRYSFLRCTMEFRCTQRLFCS